MPTPADQRRKEDRQPLHPPKKYHHAPSIPKRRVPSNTFKKEATTTPLLPGLVLGFPPVRGGQWGEGCTRRPSGRSGGTHRRRRVGAGRAARDFSRPETTTATPDKRKRTAQHAAHQPVPPRISHHIHRFTEATNTRPGGRTRRHQARRQPHRI